MANILLIHSDTTDGSVAFEDSANGNAVTPSGGVRHSTAQAKFGASSIYFDGGADYLILPKIMPYGAPFTFDCWAFVTSLANNRPLLAQAENNSPGGQLIYVRNTGKYRYLRSANAGGALLLEAVNSVPTDQWVHLATVFDGEYWYNFIDGNLEATVADTGGWFDGDQTLEIGREYYLYDSGYKNYFLGYLDEIRIADEAVWTDSFTPPAAPYGLGTISGRALTPTGDPVDLIAIRAWDSKVHVASIAPDSNGDWSAEVYAGQYDVTAYVDGCQPYCHGPYTVDPS